LNAHIIETYNAQEKVTQGNVQGRMLQFFPTYVSAKRSDIKNNENLLYALKRQHVEKLEELKMVMGEHKVIETMKEQKKMEYKKNIQKKIDENIEELNMIRLGQK
jgi:hypothetical protein